MFRDLSRLGKISVVVCVLILDHRVSRTMRKLIGKIASQIGSRGCVGRGLAFYRALMGIAVMSSRHKSSLMTRVAKLVAGDLIIAAYNLKAKA
jgi:hypothetical protein